jgi:hypothetical protein
MVLHPVPQNRVQDEGKGVQGTSRKRRFSLRLCGFASEKIARQGRHTSPLVPSHLYTTLCPAPVGEGQRSSLHIPIFLQTTLILQFSWHFLQFS